jgi:hypothetical protein
LFGLGGQGVATPSELLARWSDPVLGELAWDDAGRAWRGTAEFSGRAVRLSLGPVPQPASRGAQLALIEASRAALVGLRRAEPELRRRAAEELAERLAEPDAEGELSPQEVAGSLELEEVNPQGEGGALVYSWPSLFPAWPVQVFFDASLAFEEVVVGG